MRQVLRERPECAACGERYQCLWDIDSFPFGRIIICHECCVRVATYLAHHNLLDSNSFSQALLMDETLATEDEYTTFILSGLEHPACYPLTVKRHARV